MRTEKKGKETVKKPYVKSLLKIFAPIELDRSLRLRPISVLFLYSFLFNFKFALISFNVSLSKILPSETFQPSLIYILTISNLTTGTRKKQRHLPSRCHSHLNLESTLQNKTTLGILSAREAVSSFLRLKTMQ